VVTVTLVEKINLLASKKIADLGHKPRSLVKLPTLAGCGTEIHPGQSTANTIHLKIFRKVLN